MARNWIAAVLFLLITSVGALAPQSHSEEKPAPQKPAVPAADKSAGVATGGVYAPVKDAQSRPITAGGFVDGAPVVFAEIARSAGLTAFHHRSGTPEKNYILEVAGSGVASCRNASGARKSPGEPQPKSRRKPAFTHWFWTRREKRG